VRVVSVCVVLCNSKKTASPSTIVSVKIEESRKSTKPPPQLGSYGEPFRSEKGQIPWQNPPIPPSSRQTLHQFSFPRIALQEDSHTTADAPRRE
jgi:hypothetical protein